jgi:hypothetical protein
MADIAREGHEIVLKLSAGERILVLRGKSASRSRR